MTTEPLREVRDHFSDVIDRVERHHERVTVTRNGRPVAVLISPADLAELEETLDILSDPDALADIRRRWKGALVVKGVLHPQDAARLAELGADGVVVSNHGGRQLDSAPAPIEALPAVRAAVGPRLPVLLDGGVRRGEDIARAVALGADMVLLGRPFLYAAAARGARRGGGELFAILADELDRAMTQLGASTLAELRRVEVFAPTTFNAAPARPDLRAVESRRTAP